MWNHNKSIICSQDGIGLIKTKGHSGNSTQSGAYLVSITGRPSVRNLLSVLLQEFLVSSNCQSRTQWNKVSFPYEQSNAENLDWSSNILKTNRNRKPVIVILSMQIIKKEWMHNSSMPWVYFSWTSQVDNYASAMLLCSLLYNFTSFLFNSTDSTQKW